MIKKDFFFLLFALFLFTAKSEDTILILDFGSPITPYIALCIQQVRISTRTCWYTDAENVIKQINPKGIVFSGSPASVIDPNSPRVPEGIFTLGIPILGICYGQQLMCVQLGGSVVKSEYPEWGETSLYITNTCALTQNIWPPNDAPITIWMGHEDYIESLPKGFTSIAHTSGTPHAIIADDIRKFYGLQFHPEVQHIKEGQRIIHTFVLDIVGAQPDFSIIPPKINLTLYVDNIFACCKMKSK